MENQNSAPDSLWPCRPIGYVRGGFAERFGVPRQARLAPDVPARIEIVRPYNRREAWQGLERFSHIWLVFGFHAVRDAQWKPTVRPPRLGGKQRMGVFATRSPHRPNHLGLSAVALSGIDLADGKVELAVRGVDVMDGTPIFDIKPYIPYADAIPDAQGAWASDVPPPKMHVGLTETAAAQCRKYDAEYAAHVPLQRVIEQIVALDPRPAINSDEVGGDYGMRFQRWDVRWRVTGQIAEVYDIVDVGADSSAINRRRQ